MTNITLLYKPVTPFISIHVYNSCVNPGCTSIEIFTFRVLLLLQIIKILLYLPDFALILLNSLVIYCTRTSETLTLCPHTHTHFWLSLFIIEEQRNYVATCTL